MDVLDAVAPFDRADLHQIARFLAGHSAVARVHYPGLPDHPRHALARAQMHEFGSIVSFDLAGGTEAVRPFMDTLEFFAITPSLGSVESLAMPPQLLGVRGLSREQRALSGIGEGTVRLSIGIEDTDELIGDLDEALAKVGS